MDKKLLDALQDIGDTLEYLADVLDSGGTATSNIAEALQKSLDGDTLKVISQNVIEIKTNTETIISNQDKIIEMMGKDSEKKSPFAFAGDDSNKKKLTSGISTIMLIAGAVLAIGLAFKLIGSVDFLSVIGLSLAIYVLSEAFTKIGDLEGLTLVKVLLIGALTVSMALGIVASSIVLGKVQPIGIPQIFTAILIAGGMSIMMYGLAQVVKGMDGVSLASALITALILPYLITGMATGIVSASRILGDVQPFGLTQFISSVLISGLFVVLSYAIYNTVRGLQNVDPGVLIASAIMFPLLFTAMSFAIAWSSQILQDVVPIGWEQFVGSIAISVIFVALAFAAYPITLTIGKLTWKNVLLLPLFFVLMSGAIVGASMILQYYEHIPFGTMWNILLFSMFVGLSFVVMGATMWLVGKMGIENIATGAVGIVIISLALMVSSLILGLGSYETYPDIDWALGVGLSTLTFGLLALGLGAAILSTGGLGAVAIGLGLVTIPVIATGILATAAILDGGSYSDGPPLEWAKSVSLLLSTFANTVVVLGTLAAIPIAGGRIINRGTDAAIAIAEAIKKASFILSEGVYTNSVSKEWAEGVALSIGAFSQVYKILLTSQALSIFGGDQVSGKDLSDAITSISQSIITAAFIFNKYSGAFDNPPPKEWAEGVGLSIAAFSPVFEALQSQSGKGGVLGFFKGGGYSPKDMSDAILTISASIIVAAKFFNEYKGTFDEGYPSKEWGEGVGSAISAFAPTFTAMMEGSGWFKSGKDVIDELSYGINTISRSIVSSARIFSGQYYNPISQQWETQEGFNNIWGSYPSTSWAEGVGDVITTFTEVFTGIMSGGAWYKSGKKVINEMTYAIDTITGSIVSSARIFSGQIYNSKTHEWEVQDGLGGIWNTYPSVSWVEGVGDTITTFATLFTDMMENSNWFNSGKRITKAVDTISKSIVSSARIFSGQYYNAETQQWETQEGFGNIWNTYPSVSWVEGVSGSIRAFAPIFTIMMEGNWFKSGKKVIDEMTYAINRVSRSIVSSARIFSGQYYNPISQQWITQEGFDNVWNSYPSISWAENVRNVISTFTSVFSDILDGGDWFKSGKTVIDEISYAITRVSRSIVSSARIFSGQYYNPISQQWITQEGFDNVWNSYPSTEWAESVKNAIGAFTGVFSTMVEGSGWFKSGKTVIDEMTYAIDTITGSIVSSARIFSGQYYNAETQQWETQAGFENIWNAYPSVEWVINIGNTITSYSEMVKDVPNFLNHNKFRRISDSLIEMAKKFYNNRQYFENIIDREFIKSIMYTLTGFNHLINEITVDDDNNGFFNLLNRSNDPITRLSDRMIRLAKGYDVIAESLIKLSIASKALNVTDGNTLSDITNDIMNVGYNKVKKDDSSDSSDGGEVNKAPSIRLPFANRSDDSNKKMSSLLNDKFDLMIELLEKLNDTGVSVNETLTDGLIDESPKDRI